MAREDIERISALIKTVAADRTMLMVEHNLSVVADLCDRITVLTRGEVLAEGDYETVSADPAVREAYLGPAMLTPVATAMPETRALLTVNELQAWYGESPHPARRHVRSARQARWSRCSAATASARPRRSKSIMGIVEQRTGSVSFRRNAN